LIHIDNLAKVPTKLVNLPALRADLGTLILDQDCVLLPREYMDFSKLGEVVYSSREYVRRFSLDANTVLWEAQWPAFIAMMLSGNGILNLAPGKGKALAHGEPVITNTGEVPIEHIKIGDLVANPDGTFYPVTGVFPQGERDLYTISFTDGTVVTCDEDHLWTLQRKRNRQQYKPPITIKTKDLILKPLRNSDGHLYFTPPTCPIEYVEQPLPIDPYTLGALLGDGGLTRKSIEITSADPEILDNLKLPGYVLVDRHSKTCGKAKRYGITRIDQQNGISLYSVLKSIGLAGVSSHTKFIPNIYEINSIENRLSLLQGLFDTDGTPTASKAIEYCTTSPELAQGVQRVVYSLGGTCTFSERYSRYTRKDGTRSSPFHSYRLLIKLPKGLRGFRLTRKQDKMQGRRQREPYKAITKIEYAGKGEATCISVDSPDHLFLTRNCTPTHNTRTAIEYLLTWGVKTAIIVDKIGLLDQWHNALIEHVAEVKDHIGIVHQNKAELDKNIVLISAKTLIPRLESGKITSEDLADFDLVIFDECHHFAAPTFLQLCPLFGGLRLGLTATPNREDGLDRLFKMHLGAVFYSDLIQDLIPKIEFIPMGTVIYDEDQEAISDVSGELHYKKLCIWLGQNSARNLRIINDVTNAATQGHHVLVLTHSKEHTEVLTKLFEEHTFSLGLTISTIYINGSSHKIGRTEKIRGHSVIFATFDVAAEALDAPSLSYLYFATPPGAREYGNTLQQALGRIQRKHSSKLHPEVRILEDINIDMCRSLLRQVKRRLREWKYPYKELKKEKKLGSTNYKRTIR